MSKHTSIEPSYSNFSVTWELTLKCNLDCSYCNKNGHDNSTSHPPLNECKDTVDFLVQYIDLYMSRRAVDQRHVIVNVFGGESLFHPNIVEILDYFLEKYQPYKDKWTMELHTVTNLVVNKRVWDKIVDKFDYWTVSYHIESTTEKQQELIRKNIIDLQAKDKRFHVSLLMHPQHWDECINTIKWCKANNIRVLPRQIDHGWEQFRFWYSSGQAKWMRAYHSSGSSCQKECKPTVGQVIKESVIKFVNLSSEGRQCCGGTPLHVDGDYSNTQTHVDNRFKGWSCGVNYFFVFVKQLTKEVFVNKDCRVNFDGEVGPIGYIDNYEPMLNDLRNNTLPVIKCVKSRCYCGICTPKASTEETYNNIIGKYLV